MQMRPLGSSGLQASVVAFGAWAIGGWKWGGTDAQAAIKAVQTALDAGVNLIDTAAVYGFGLSEELVGQAIGGRRREDILIATKCGLRWDIDTPGAAHALHGSASAEQPIYRTLARESVRHELHQSLKRLGTDYIDLYQPHWPDPNTATPEIMDTLQELKTEGKIRAIGTCNASVEDLQAYRAAGELDTDQERYSVLDRQCETSHLLWCQANGAAFLAYSPMAQGLLTGRMNSQRQYPADDQRHANPRFSQENRRRISTMLDPVRELANERDISVEHLVLAWTLQRPGLTHVLVGARTAEQARHNARAGSLDLAPDELARLTTWFDAFQPDD